MISSTSEENVGFAHWSDEHERYESDLATALVQALSSYRDGRSINFINLFSYLNAHPIPDSQRRIIMGLEDQWGQVGPGGPFAPEAMMSPDFNWTLSQVPEPTAGSLVLFALGATVFGRNRKRS